MNNNHNTNNNNNANSNIFQNNNANFEELLFEDENNSIINEEQEFVEAQARQSGHEVYDSPQAIVIPNYLTDTFDETAVTQLSRGVESVKKLVHYLDVYKNVHFGNPNEVSFFEIALLASGRVKLLRHTDIPNVKVPHLAGQTTKHALKEYIKQSDLLRPYLPFKFILKTDLNRRVLHYSDFHHSFYAGIIMAKDMNGFLKHLEDRKNKTIDALVRKDRRKVHTWQTQREQLFTPVNSSKSAKVSKGIANKMDLIDLLEHDARFARLQEENVISGVEDQKCLLTREQVSMTDGFVTLNRPGYTNLNNNVLSKVHQDEIRRLKLKESVMRSINNENDEFKVKYVEILINLGIESMTGWRFDGLTPYNYEKLYKMVMKTIKTIRISTNDEKIKFIMKSVLLDWLKNFHKER